ncbi:hypothetical protein ACLKA7_005237, partial [Drosophila subpalustris]
AVQISCTTCLNFRVGRPSPSFSLKLHIPDSANFHERALQSESDLF